MAVKAAGAKVSPEAQLKTFIGRMSPEDQKVFKAVRAAVRKRIPAANELVYDYSGTLVVSYTPTELGKEGILSLSARPDDLRLYFGQGPKLPDPKKLLKGSAGTVRYIEMESARQLTTPEVEALIRAAIAQARVPLPSTGRGKILDRSAGQTTARKKAAK